MTTIATTRKPAGTLIIGAGQAGLQLATSLRELGDTHPITVIGGELHPPYQRPPLSKAFLSGTALQEELALRGSDFYRDNDIAMICGEWVEAIELHDAESSAGHARTASGRRVEFDRLAFTVGGTPRRMNAPGADLAGIHYLRTLDDAVALKDDLNRAARVVVVGGGFVGLEIAAAATSNGKNVVVLEAQDRLMSRAVAPEMSAFYSEAHARRGTHIRLGAAVSGFRGSDRVEGVELADGEVIDADVVVVGIGLLPHTELAKSIGLAGDHGVIVDESGNTRIRGIVAAGDCAISAHRTHGQIRLESVPNAIAQAKTAAAALLGREPGTPSVPWFWSDQADLKLQMAGLTMGYDQVVLRGDVEGEHFSALYYRDGHLIAVEAVNASRDYMAARRILEAGGNIPPESAADTEIPLKTYLVR
ncbi:MAG TPA: FAD-dependent oxidoreductase [Mycetocola sp.]|jgi:3-phenylpropionate/trans-cinnamate dioxygenase ferredoxin reductase subunit|uniref:NAD(P)/FAD-dependent oxidoreductase n=1 Tax=Mycetocola sp. TaxID=1871042 RepID=UPI00262FEDD6|nr:FAD-dependent oxidoreductase [Mycetocola sp.]MCU1559975.1 ferredoxin [Mycetocola sp.]HEV7849703.1 FAD-dependent oxidoreductase [Mycetocola sp.]